MDVALLRRVATRGMCLDIETQLDDSHPLEAAILHVLTGRGRPTYILRTGHADYAAQMRIEEANARVTLLAPAPQADCSPSPWLALLDCMVEQGGRRGAQVITAEVPPDELGFEVFRQAGFSIYSRVRLYQLLPSNRLSNTVKPAPALMIKPITEEDFARLYTLYYQIVPQMVQQVMVPHWSGYALFWEGRLMGCLSLWTSKEKVLIQPYLHPELYDLVPQVFAQMLEHLPRQHLVYVRLHAFQEWLKNALEMDFGFQEHARFALMARHAIVPQLVQSLSPLAAITKLPQISPTESIRETWYGIQNHRQYRRPESRFAHLSD